MDTLKQAKDTVIDTAREAGQAGRERGEGCRGQGDGGEGTDPRDGGQGPGRIRGTAAQGGLVQLGRGAKGPLKSQGLLQNAPEALRPTTSPPELSRPT